MREREAEGEGHRESLAGPARSAQSPMQGLQLMSCEITTWAKFKSQMLNQPSHPGAPNSFALWKITLRKWKGILFASILETGIYIPTVLRTLSLGKQASQQYTKHKQACHKEDIHMGSKHVKKWSPLLAIRGTQIKTPMRLLHLH